jgi:hypothetical protein
VVPLWQSAANKGQPNQMQMEGMQQMLFFFYSTETVQHLIISCPNVRIIWRMIYFTYNLPPPTNIINVFGNWLNGMPTDVKARIRIGISALCWSIWTYQNNIIFNKQNNINFLQVIRLVAHWIHL